MAGYTARVTDLLETMDDVKHSRFKKAIVSSADTGENAEREFPLRRHEAANPRPVLKGRGKIIEAEEIRFEEVPLISPNGDVLIKSMTFHVEPGVGFVTAG